MFHPPLEKILRRIKIAVPLLFLFALLIIAYLYYEYCYRADTEPRTKLTETSTEPLWTLDYFRTGLKRYRKLYRISMVAPRGEIDDGTYVIPGLRATKTLTNNDASETSICTSMTPQGIAVSDRYLFVSAYCHTHSHNSVIYLIDKETHEFLKEIVLPGKPHVGSLAYDEKFDNLWVCGQSGMLPQANALNLQSIEEYSLDKDLRPIAYTFSNYVLQMRRSSFMTYENEHIYIGYFHTTQNGVLRKYRIEADGNMYRSILELNGINTESGLAIDTISIPKRAQGMAFYYDRLFLSQSLGILPSRLVVFGDKPVGSEYRDDTAILSLRLPRMLEQICVYGDELYMIFESAAYAYRNLPAFPVDRILKIDIKELHLPAK